MINFNSQKNKIPAFGGVTYAHKTFVINAFGGRHFVLLGYRMKWFQHLTNERDKEDVAEMIDLLGFEGYGIYNAILEKIADTMDGDKKTSTRLSLKMWASSLPVSTRKFQNFIQTTSKLGLIEVETDGEYLTLSCPILLESLDEYTRKKRRVSGHAPDNVAHTYTKTYTKTKKTKKKYIKKKVELIEPEKFEEFWKAYPPCPSSRRSKKITGQRWAALIQSGEVDADGLLRAGRIFVDERQGQDPDYTCGPQVFLGRDEKWRACLEAPEPETEKERIKRIAAMADKMTKEEGG
jgi:hypothetical protein